MAFADLGSLGAVGDTSNNQANLSLVTTAAIAAGDLVVVVVAADNIANGGDDNAVTGVTLGVGGQALTKAVQIANALAAQAGASCSIWYGKATSALALGGTIRATFGSGTLVDASALTARKYSFTGNVALAATPTTLVNNTGADPGSLDVTTPNIACLRVRGIAVQVGNNTNLTPTASWTAWANGNSSTTTSAAEVCARAESIISTATGAASDPTYVSGIYASAYVAFKETAAYSFQAGTGAAASAGASVTLRPTRNVRAVVGAATAAGPNVNLTYTPVSTGGTGITFDPPYKAVDNTLSNGNLTVEKTSNAGTFSTAFSELSAQAKVYCELTLNVNPNPLSTSVGIAVAVETNPNAWNDTAYPGWQATDIGFYSSGDAYCAATAVGPTATFKDGDRVAVACDWTTSPKTVRFRNMSMASPWSSPISIATETGATGFRVGMCANAIGGKVTADFDGPYHGAPPASGYTRWDGSALTFAPMTLDPGHTGSHLILSNGNLTATMDSSGATFTTSYSYRAPVGAGKLYCEAIADHVFSGGGFATLLGVSSEIARAETAFMGDYGLSLGYAFAGYIMDNSSNVASIEVVNDGDHIAMAVDHATSGVQFRNITQGGAWSTARTIGGLGTTTAVAGVTMAVAAGRQVTMVFDGPFLGTPPGTGYTKWDGGSLSSVNHYTLTALTGAVAIAGASVNLTYTPAVTHYTLTALTGAAAIAGASVNLTYTPAGGSSISIGSDVNFMSGFGSSFGAERIAQTFTSIGTSVSSIKTWMKRRSDTTDSMTLKIYTVDGAHKPVTQVGVTSNAIPYSAVNLDGAGSASELTFTFSPPISVSSGVEYAISWERTGAYDSSLQLAWSTSLNNTNPYAGGVSLYANGSSWTATSGDDYVCVINFGAATTGYVLSALTGAVTAAGASVTLRVSRKMQAAAGAATIAGADVNLRRNRNLPIGVGAATIAGPNVALRRNRNLPVGVGAATITGLNVALRYAHKALAGTGAVTAAGSGVNLRYSGEGITHYPPLQALPGAVTAAGAAVTLRLNRNLFTGTGVVTIAGKGVTLRTGRKLLVATGVVQIAGLNVELRYGAGLKLQVLPGAITIGGTPVTLRRGRGMPVGTGAVTIAGPPVELRPHRSHRLQATAGAVLATGGTVNLSRSGTAQPGPMRYGIERVYLNRW